MYIPILDVKTGELYSEKNRPSNWNFRAEGFDSQVVSTVRWANENGTLSIAIDFAGQLPGIPVHFGLVALLHFTMNRLESNRAVCI